MADAWGTPGWTVNNGIPLTSDLPPATVPDDVSMTTIVTQFGAIDGKRQNGFVMFEASTDLTHIPSGGISHRPVWLGRVIEGRASVKVPATDNTTLSPEAWNYKVTVIMYGQAVRAFHTLVPTSLVDVPYTSLVPIA